MTPTPDTALAARLAAMEGVRFMSVLYEAYRSGQLITIADHNDAVQAAVAKAVDDTFRSCRTIAASRDTEDDYGDEIARVIEERRLLDAAIRARKGDAL